MNTASATTRLPSRIHAVGIGGMGLGPLAIYLAALGHRVSGSDDHLTDAMRAHLERAGITLCGAGVPPASGVARASRPPFADGLPDDVQLLVISSAIAPAHPLLQAARARNLPVIRRGELLAALARTRRLVAVCGSHGKTTTTAMLVSLLRAAGFPADYILGGLFADDTPPAAAAAAVQGLEFRVQSSESGVQDSGNATPADNSGPETLNPEPLPAAAAAWLVAEIDESDGTIENFSPEITVVTNIDWDHPDHYRTRADLEAAFDRLFARTTGRVIRDLPAPPDAASFPDRIAGAFNRRNAAAALAAAACMGVPAPTPDLLAAFPGVRRRQTVLLAADELTVIEDYAHHPAEIRALLASLRERAAASAPPARLVAVFQPHRYSRTRQFLREFADALRLADEIHLLDVYGAGESPLPGGATADLAALLPEATCHRASSLALPLFPTPALVAFIGAGNIDAMARRWLVDRARWSAAADTLRAVLPPDTTTLLRREEPLARKTTLGVGGSARLYAEPATRDDLAALVRAAAAAGIPLLMLGRGSNLIVPDEGVDALVLSLRHPSWATFEALPDGTLRVGAGLRLKELCGKAVTAGLHGFEFLEGIPGNIGGALRMNAGAMGSWIFDIVESVDLLTLAGDLLTLRRDQLHTGYRHCAELENAIALGAILRPAALADHSDDVARQVDAYRDKRKKTQPREPSAGCIFKNPEGDSAGRLIDATGLKGLRIGGAEVSPVHANFIVNHGQATADDVIALVHEVRARVHAATGTTLEPEAILYGQDWATVLDRVADLPPAPFSP
ncbi:UDP-N-acetylenolpyruvoylglucosamine reductase [Opitutaceae bacterium TAV1]|nr:UDP-N-acetylenolpyruvoylglucosamine reductase [Opitutaceae bacterium TAV1]